MSQTKGANMFNHSSNTREAARNASGDKAVGSAGDARTVRGASQTKKSTTTPNDITEIVFVIDASGSMHGMEADTIGGINSVLDENRRLEGRANVSIVQFSNESHVIVDRASIRKVHNLGPHDYRTGGCTALLDALGGAIRHTQMIQDNMPAEYKAAHVLFVVITDGFENASRRYSRDQVKRMVEAHREQGWEFVFLAANIDAVAEAATIGIDAGHATGYVNDGVGNGLAYDAVRQASVAVRSCGAVPKGWNAAAAADKRRRG